MSKATLFVVACSIAILAVFGTFCFLMSSINPPPIQNDTETETETLLANYYLRNMPPVSEDVSYGLERAKNPPDPTDSSRLANIYKRFNLTNLLPAVKHPNPNIVRVSPPIWPPNTTRHMLTSPKRTEHTLAVTTNISNSIPIRSKLNDSNDTVIETTKFQESPIHRRSINAITRRVDESTGDVILKIIDYDGQSRIEIKLSPNEIVKKSRMHRSYLKNDSKFSMTIKGTGKDVDFNELPDNTEIKILSNDTIIIENDDHDLDDENNDFVFETDTNGTKQVENRANYSVENHLPAENKTITCTSTAFTRAANKIEAVRNTAKTPKLDVKMSLNGALYESTATTEVFGLKVLFDNVTRSFTETYDMYVSENKTI